MKRFVAVDLETTGLDPDKDQIIEVGIAGEKPDGSYFEDTWTLPFFEDDANPKALEVNGWGKRPFPAMKTEYESVAILMNALDNVHIVGKNPQFDVGFLKVEFAVQEITPNWHHRLVDVGALAWGWFNGREATLEGGTGYGPLLQPPNVDSVENEIFDGYEELQRELVEGYHTALCDARWAYRVFREIVPWVDS